MKQISVSILVATVRSTGGTVAIATAPFAHQLSDQLAALDPVAYSYGGIISNPMTTQDRAFPAPAAPPAPETVDQALAKGEDTTPIIERTARKGFGLGTKR